VKIHAVPAVPPTLRVGIDLVQISRVTESLEKFGERFLRRVFTDREIAFATDAPCHTAERLAARFAAKEATIKALALAEQPTSWRDIEVRRAPSGDCVIQLNGGVGRAAALAGVTELVVSLSHEGDYAAAVVVARLQENSGYDRTES
jgi:holo-[acyl-carrier protein] synthase